MTTSPGRARGHLEPSSGSLDAFPDLWDAFVQMVLEITIEAYQSMRKKVKARQDWEENHFTINLGMYMNCVARRQELNLTVVPLAKIHTPDMYKGTTSTKLAGEIDIRLWGQWENPEEVYFAWECKRVGERRVDKRHKDLINEYVSEGILRFIDEEYSQSVADAGMLGYILSGETGSIVDGINRSMHRKSLMNRLIATDHLKPASALANFSDVYQSHHDRGNSTIRLHHLFFTFDFE